MAKLAILYQHMSPTRVPIFDQLYEMIGDRLKVFYPSVLEGDRDQKWRVPVHHPYHLLKPRSIAYTLFSQKRYVHINIDVFAVLDDFDPACAIVYGFHPTALLAWLYTRIRRKKFVIATDGCLKSDRKNSLLHPLVRKLVIPTAVAAVGTSKGSLDLFDAYGTFEGRYFNCYLCADNDRFAPYRNNQREYDMMFSGQFIDRKLPHFFVDVIAEMKKQKPDVSALLLGDGVLRAGVIGRLKSLGIRFKSPGFLRPDELPLAYSSARILLFPTKLDAYGVVANEALAVGTPVIANDEPGAVGEVILDGITGLVLPLDAKLWADHALRLLSQPKLYREMSHTGFDHVQRYTYRAAAEGLEDAFEYALNH